MASAPKPSDTDIGGFLNRLSEYRTTLSEADQKQAAEIVRQVYAQVAPELKDPDKIPISDLKRIVVSQPYAGDWRTDRATSHGQAGFIELNGFAVA